MTELHPIRSDLDHQAALREIEQLWGASDGSPDGDRLDILVTLVESYEDMRWPLKDIDPVDAIETAMAYEGRSRADLGRLIGPSRATEILQRKRALTLPMIRKIADAWHVPERLLVKEYRLAKAIDGRPSPRPNATTRAAMREGRAILQSRAARAR